MVVTGWQQAACCNQTEYALELVRVGLCDFVDRLSCPRDQAINEITRTYTNLHEQN